MSQYDIQNIASNRLEHYKRKDLEFDYFSVDEFNDLADNNQDIEVLGYIDFSETNKTNIDSIFVSSNNRNFNFEITYLEDYKNYNPDNKNSKRIKGKIIGYIQIGNDEFIAVVKKRGFILILLILLGLGIGAGAMLLMPKDTTPNQPTTDIETEEDNTWDGSLDQNKPTVEQEQITIPGYSNLYVTADMPTIKLINPDGNTVYLQYTIKKDGEVIYETKAIKPNNMVEADFKSILPEGEHTLLFEINTFDIETNQACNGATQEVQILVK